MWPSVNGMSCYDNQRINIALFLNATNEHIMLINIKYVYAVYETFLCNFYAKLLIVHNSATTVPQIFLKFPNVILKMQKRNLYSKSCVINQIFQILSWQRLAVILFPDPSFDFKTSKHFLLIKIAQRIRLIFSYTMKTKWSLATRYLL